MKKIHVNETCAHRHNIVHGRRRRRCVRCGITWTVRQRRRGRKRKRIGVDAVRRYLQKKSVSVGSRMLRRSRDQFLKHTVWPNVSMIVGPWVLIADALHIRTRHYRIIVHLLFLKGKEEERAYALPPYFHDHGENYHSWQEALNTVLPLSVRSRVSALICDGKSGLLRLGREHGWLIQRCQFHLIARLQLKRSKYALSRHRKEGIKLYELVKAVCDTHSQKKLGDSLRILSHIAETETNRYLKTILSGFVKHHEEYRTYLEHPDLNLPKTTNAIESVNSLIRDLIRRMRGFSNADTAHLWIEALLKYRNFVCVNHRN